jgi:hypothetical protein
LILFIRDYIKRNQAKQTINPRHLLFKKARPHAYHQQLDAVRILPLYLQNKKASLLDMGAKGPDTQVENIGNYVYNNQLDALIILSLLN